MHDVNFQPVRKLEASKYLGHNINFAVQTSETGTELEFPEQFQYDTKEKK